MSDWIIYNSYSDKAILKAMPFANPEYVRQRDALIPEADRAASRDCSKVKDRDAWDRVFFGHMDRICREQGVVV